MRTGTGQKKPAGTGVAGQTAESMLDRMFGSRDAASAFIPKYFAILMFSIN